MPHVEESIEIRAPVEVVFGLIADQPERMAEWWPPIELQERVTPPPTAVGSISRYVYNMMNVTIRGEHEVLALDPNQYLRVKTISGIDSAFDFYFAPAGEGTRLTIRVEYSLPGSIVGQLMNRVIIEERNLKDLQEGLRNLKAMAENS
ncbi:MAG: SRPBCC family protein [Anaerolineae bacterium]|nr:SRPBCC family protein [Anaerolineae bacterium]